MKESSVTCIIVGFEEGFIELVLFGGHSI